MEIKQCRNCGAEIDDNESFCPKCQKQGKKNHLLATVAIRRLWNYTTNDP